MARRGFGFGSVVRNRAALGGITRNFTTLKATFGMYFPIPTYVMAVGDTVEFKYLAPSAIVTPSNNELLGGDATGGSDAAFRMLTNGNFAESGFSSTFDLDGVSTTTATAYPIDGKVHTVKLTSDSTLSIAAIAGKQAGTTTVTGIMYDVVIKNSGGTIQRNYPIDETWIGPSTVLNDTSGNAQHGTAVNIDLDDSEPFTLEGIDWFGIEQAFGYEFWTAATGVSIVGETIVFAGTQAGLPDSNIRHVAGVNWAPGDHLYRVLFSLVDVAIAGRVRLHLGSTTSPWFEDEDDYEMDIQSVNGTFALFQSQDFPTGPFDGTVSNISIKRILQGTP